MWRLVWSFLSDYSKRIASADMALTSSSSSAQQQSPFDPHDFAFRVLPQRIGSKSDCFFHEHQDGFMCFLCYTDCDFSEEKAALSYRHDHVFDLSTNHRDRFHHFKAAFDKDAERILSWRRDLQALLPRIEKIQSTDWKVRLYSKVPASLANLDLAPVQQELHEAELREDLCILSLVAWRAACQDAIMPPPPHFAGSRLHWVLEGWKTCKLQNREAKAIHVIPSLVLPFLSDYDVRKDKADPVSSFVYKEPYTEAEFNPVEWAFRVLPQRLTPTSDCLFLASSFTRRNLRRRFRHCLLCDDEVVPEESDPQEHVDNSQVHQTRFQSLVSTLRNTGEALYWRNRILSKYQVVCLKQCCQSDVKNDHIPTNYHCHPLIMHAKVGKLIIRSLDSLDIHEIESFLSPGQRVRAYSW